MKLIVLHTFLAHAGGTTSLSFSPDGKMLASGGYDCKVRLWDTTTWQQNQVHPGHRRGHVAFSPDGNILISGGMHGDATVYDRVDWHVVQTLDDTSNTWALAFTPDGGQLIVIQPDVPIQMWETQTWRLTKQVEVTPNRMYALSFLPQKDILALAVKGKDSPVLIFTRDFSQQIASFSANNLITFGMDFSPDGTLLATAGKSNTLNVWNTIDWDKEAEVIGNETMLNVAFSPDGRMLAASSLDGTVTLYSFDQGAFHLGR